MKIIIPKIKKNFRKGGIHADPNIYWDILLFLFAVIVVASFIFGFSLFQKTNKEFTLSDENTDSQRGTFSKDRIEKVLEYFKERENKSASILNSSSPIIDPSI